MTAQWRLDLHVDRESRKVKARALRRVSMLSPIDRSTQA